MEPGKAACGVMAVDLARVADLWEENQECLKQRLGHSDSARFGARWVFMPQVPAARFNHVSKVRVPSSMVNDLIDECRTFFRQNGLPLCCIMTTPATQPADLGERLYRLGFTTETNPVMIWDGRTLPEVPEGVRVELAPEEQCDLVYQLIRHVFFPDANRSAAHHLRRGVEVSYDLGARNYVAYIGDQPVGAGTLFRRGQMGGIYNMCTLPAYRGRGVATAIIAASLADASRLGCAYVGLTPTTQGRPLYEKLGFTEVYQERYFVERFY